MSNLHTRIRMYFARTCTSAATVGTIVDRSADNDRRAIDMSAGEGISPRYDGAALKDLKNTFRFLLLPIFALLGRMWGSPCL
jgi:hypothetical protein